MTIPIYLPDGSLPDHLQHLDLPTVTEQPASLSLVFEKGQLGLKDFKEPKTGPVVVDFSSEALQYRSKKSSVKNEAIAKALGIKGGQTINIIDATAGLGRDAFMLMTLGANLTLLERSPVVAALLLDGIHRASISGEMPHNFLERFKFLPGQAQEQLSNWQQERPDAIYLDPMFPHKKKSALVKKEMRLFQQLLGPDEDANLLLEPALELALKRVVVKRPDYAPFLADSKPTMQIKGKKHRFDVYLT